MSGWQRRQMQWQELRDEEMRRVNRWFEPARDGEGFNFRISRGEVIPLDLSTARDSYQRLFLLSARERVRPVSIERIGRMLLAALGFTLCLAWAEAAQWPLGQSALLGSFAGFVLWQSWGWLFHTRARLRSARKAEAARLLKRGHVAQKAPPSTVWHEDALSIVTNLCIIACVAGYLGVKELVHADLFGGELAALVMVAVGMGGSWGAYLLRQKLIKRRDAAIRTLGPASAQAARLKQRVEAPHVPAQ